MSTQRTLREVVSEIEADWLVINNQAARQALNYMKTMGAIKAPFVADPNGYAVVGSFLAHAIGWKGQVARRVKRELRMMCGHPKP
jgi:hypothetical protein